MSERTQTALGLTTPCIEWTGSRAYNGYGFRRIDGKLHRVHRLAWQQARGPIPPGLYVLHRCDNPPCYNIEHLFLGTHSENMADMHAKGRGDRSECRRGHALTLENVVVVGGYRRCKTCRAVSQRRARSRKRQRAKIEPAI